MQPTMVRAMLGTFGRRLDGLDMDEVVTAGQALFEGKALSWAQLGAALAERWPEREPLALANAIRAHICLVQIPPRGLWGRGGAAKHVPAETWLGQSSDHASSVDDLVVRYLRAFGPASVADVQTWSGLTKLAEVVDRLRPRLVTFRSPEGRELFDLPDAPRPGPATPAPPRYLPVFDNLLLSHSDRSHVISDDIRRAVPATSALAAGTVLVDGWVSASWRATSSAGAATLVVSPLAPIPRHEVAGVHEEGKRLFGFLFPGQPATVELGVHE
jgi:hypothetical protein